MTDHASSAQVEKPSSSLGEWSVHATRDRALLLQLLNADRAYSAYAIGDLEPALFDQCEWFLAQHERGPWAIALLFKGLDPHALLLYGDPRGSAVVLGTAMRPARAYSILQENHLGALEAHYALAEQKRMVRMVWNAAHPLPAPNPLAFRLTGANLTDLQSLYRIYAEVHFSPYQLLDGVFYGIERDGRLVSVAGTHLVSPTYSVAAIGNVFTHPDYRGRGYANACTSGVVRELSSQVDTLVLNVGKDNVAAQRIYRKLGFAPHCEFLEAMAYRKRTTSPD